MTILDCSVGSPCIDQPVFGITEPSLYWTATTLADDPEYAWHVDFSDGSIYFHDKRSADYVRAVRTAL